MSIDESWQTYIYRDLTYVQRTVAVPRTVKKYLKKVVTGWVGSRFTINDIKVTTYDITFIRIN